MELTTIKHYLTHKSFYFSLDREYTNLNSFANKSLGMRHLNKFHQATHSIPIAGEIRVKKKINSPHSSETSCNGVTSYQLKELAWSTNTRSQCTTFGPFIKRSCCTGSWWKSACIHLVITQVNGWACACVDQGDTEHFELSHLRFFGRLTNSLLREVPQFFLSHTKQSRKEELGYVIWQYIHIHKGAQILFNIGPKHNLDFC